MCLNTKYILNPRYKEYIKSNGHSGIKPPDKKVTLIPVACGNCSECAKQKANEWKIRLSEEIKENKNGVFVTLTFNEINLNKYLDLAEGDFNEAATKAVRRFLERWRKKHKKSVKHWLVTELGHTGTERLHLHGLIFTDKPEDIEKIWANGYVYLGEYVNNKTINYITKYVTKKDEKHLTYKPKILCSPGIGKYYIKKGKSENKFRGDNTKDYYITEKGNKLQLPIYYRNNIYNEEEREKLWLYKLNKNERYIKGTRYRLRNNEEIETYINALKTARKDDEKLGYKQQIKEQDAKEFNKHIRELNINK